MNIKKQFEELARMEGRDLSEPYTFQNTNIHSTFDWDELHDEEGSHKGWVILPDYNSLDALHRIICGMDVITGDKFAYELAKIVGTQIVNQHARNWYLVASATAPQVREAILRAECKWEVE